MELDALLNLLCYALRALAVRGREGLVIAEGAATRTHCAITIWTCEARIYRNLLHTLSETTTEVCRVAVVWSVIAPRVHRRSSKIVDNIKIRRTSAPSEHLSLVAPSL